MRTNVRCSFQAYFAPGKRGGMDTLTGQEALERCVEILERVEEETGLAEYADIIRRLLLEKLGQTGAG